MIRIGLHRTLHPTLHRSVAGSTKRQGTYLELCTRTDKLDHEQKACAMALLDRIALMLRGLSSG
jgi:hypothetical protein